VIVLWPVMLSLLFAASAFGYAPEPKPWVAAGSKRERQPIAWPMPPILELAPERLLGVRGLATRQVRHLIYSSERLKTRATTHPVLSRSTSETPARAFSPWGFLPTELEARLHPVMSAAWCRARSSCVKAVRV
jgi:hypothetical protein